MADENKELNINELNDVNGGLVMQSSAEGLGLVDAARLPLASAGGAGLVDATRPKLPFKTLEEANDFARNAGLAIFDTIEAANNWINTGNRASLL